MSKLRDSSIALGIMPGTPQVSNPRPSFPVIETPRDSGAMASGETAGNYDAASMTSRPNGPGAAGTQPGADAAQAAFQANCQ